MNKTIQLNDKIKTWMINIWLFSIIALILAPEKKLFAETSTSYMQISASVSESPPSIELNWQITSKSEGFKIYKRTPFSDEGWGQPIAILPGEDRHYVDQDVVIGERYEYQIHSYLKHWQRGYITCGIEAEEFKDLGGILMVVDDRFKDDLSFELQRYRMDLIGEGYSPETIFVKADWSPSRVKSLIVEHVMLSHHEIKALTLIGHVPVPYAGRSALDGHLNDHTGTWAADVYYGDIDGHWKDEKNESEKKHDRQNNVAGDGKFDNDRLPSDVDLAVGRIDMFHMFEFLPRTELDLMKNYFEKNHAFRKAKVHVEREGYTSYLAGSWINWAPLIGNNMNMVSKSEDWFDRVNEKPFLFAGAMGGGSYNSLSGEFLNTKGYAERGGLGVFNSFLGSYFGDWDTDNNLLRAPLAAEGMGLVSHWGGFPLWYYHSMGMGYSIGDCTKLTQNNLFDYDSRMYSPHRILHGGKRGRQIALLGDPSLKAFYPKPVMEFKVEPRLGMLCSWTPSETPELGYMLYRAESVDGPFVQLWDEPKHVTKYADLDGHDQNIYMLKSVHMEHTPSGSYIQSSSGVFASQRAKVMGMSWDELESEKLSIKFSRALDPNQLDLAEFYLDGLRIENVEVKVTGHENNEVVLTFQESLSPGEHYLSIENLIDAQGSVVMTTHTLPAHRHWHENDSNNEVMFAYELNGSLEDKMGLGGNLILEGNSKFVDGGRFGGRCLSFEGLGDQASVDLPDDMIYTLSGQGLSVSFDLYFQSHTTSYGEAAVIFQLRQEYDCSFRLFQGKWSRHPLGMHFEVNNKSISHDATTNHKLEGEWRKVHYIYDGYENHYVYVDGQLFATKKGSSVHHRRRGDHRLSFGNFKGYIDNVVISRPHHNEGLQPHVTFSQPVFEDSDGDSLLESGESVVVRLKIENPGLVESGELKVEMLSKQYLQWMNQIVYVPSIPAGGEHTFEAYAYIPGEVEHDAELNFEWHVSDHYGNTWWHNHLSSVKNYVNVEVTVIDLRTGLEVSGVEVRSRGQRLISDAHGKVILQNTSGYFWVSTYHPDYEASYESHHIVEDTQITLGIGRLGFALDPEFLQVEVEAGLLKSETVEIVNTGDFEIQWQRKLHLDFKTSLDVDTNLTYNWIEGGDNISTSFYDDLSGNAFDVFNPQLQIPIDLGFETSVLGKSYSQIHLGKYGELSFEPVVYHMALHFNPVSSIYDLSGEKITVLKEDNRVVITFHEIETWSGINTYQVIISKDGPIVIQYQTVSAHEYFYETYNGLFNPVSSGEVISFEEEKSPISFSEFQGHLLPGESQSIEMVIDGRGVNPGDVYHQTHEYFLPQYYGKAVFQNIEVNFTSPQVIAVDDYINLREDDVIMLDLISNDQFEGEVQVEVVTLPLSGRVEVDALNTWYYYPHKNYYGVDQLTYGLVVDGQVVSEANVMLEIEPVNDAPLAHPKSISVFQNHEIHFDLTGEDIEGDLLTFFIDEAPHSGNVVLVDGDYVYQPHRLFAGSDHFTVRAHDGYLSSEAVTIEVQVDHEYQMKVFPQYTWPINMNDQGLILVSSWDPELGSLFYLDDHGSRIDISVDESMKYAYPIGLTSGEYPDVLIQWYDDQWNSRVGLWNSGEVEKLELFDSQFWINEMNDVGIMVGASQSTSGMYEAFIYKDGVVATLNPGGNYSYVHGLTSGENPKAIVMSYDENWQGTSYIYQDGQLNVVDNIGSGSSYLHRVNDEGLAVGGLRTHDYYYHAFLYRDFQSTDLTPDAHYSYAVGLSSGLNPKVALTEYDSSWNSHSKLWTDTQGLVQIPNLGDGQQYLSGMNADGVVVGSYRRTDLDGYVMNAFRFSDLGVMKFSHLCESVEGVEPHYVWQLHDKAHVFGSGRNESEYKSFVLIHQPSLQQVED